MKSKSEDHRLDEIALEELNDSEREAVENFTFEASARIRADAESGEGAPPPKSRARQSRRVAPQTASTPSPRPEASQAAVLKEATEEPITAERSAVVAAKRRSHKSSAKRAAARGNLKQRASNAPTRTKLRRKKGMPPWAISLGVHLVLLVGFSFLTLATLEPDDFLQWSDTPALEDVVEFQEFEVESVVDFEPIETELPSELEDPGLAALGEISADSAFTDMSDMGPLAGESIGEWGSMFGESGSGLAELGMGEGQALTSFFGTKSEARDVVFVIDNTGSMAHGELETVIAEMLKTVDQLDPSQRFYVLFFSDQVYPLYFPNSRKDFVRPTLSTKRDLRQWLDTVEICTGGVWQLIQALEAAYALEPDVVYLLTDGQHWNAVRASYKVEAVRKLRSEANAAGIVVHTLGMGCETNQDRENLAKVAEVNGGTFREVSVGPEMREVAQAKARPQYNYHTGPGPVWGTLVPKARGSWATGTKTMQPAQ